MSGEQLSQITGCAAILRFPIPELEDLSLDEDSEEEQEEERDRNSVE